MKERKAKSNYKTREVIYQTQVIKEKTRKKKKKKNI